MKLGRWTLVTGMIGAVGCAGADPDSARGTAAETSPGSTSAAQEQGAIFDATPTTNLSDGQSIALALSGFTPNTPIGVGQCRATLPATDCSTSSYAATTDAAGHFSGRLTVFRSYTSTAGTLVSCAEPGSCVAGISPLSNFEVSFREPLEFAEARSRTVQVTPNPASVGETLRFFGTGWTPIASLHVSVCVPGSIPGRCAGTTTSAFEDGLFSAQVTAPAFVSNGVSFVDCTAAPGACVGLVGEVANPAPTAVEVPLTIQGVPTLAGTASARVHGESADSSRWITTARGSRWTPNRELLVLHCFGEGLSVCARQPDLITDARGRFRACRELQSVLFDNAEFDCQTGSCSLVIADPAALTSSAVRLPLQPRDRPRAVACE